MSGSILMNRFEMCMEAARKLPAYIQVRLARRERRKKPTGPADKTVLAATAIGTFVFDGEPIPKNCRNEVMPIVTAMRLSK